MSWYEFEDILFDYHDISACEGFSWYKRVDIS